MSVSFPMDDPIDVVLDALYSATGREVTGRNPYNGICPVHPDRHRSLTITADNGTVLIHCHGGCPADEVLAALGLEWADLYGTDNGGPEDKRGTYSPQDDIEPSRRNHPLDMQALQRLHESLSSSLPSLPAGQREGWERVLSEWSSLLSLVEDRLAQRSDAGRFDFEAIVIVAAEAAVKAHSRGWDPKLGSLTTFARKSMRGAIRDEMRRQGGAEEFLDDEQSPAQLAEVPEDVYGVEADEHPPTCVVCGEPLRGRVDAKTCSKQCRDRLYRRREDGAEDYAEALVRYFDGLPEVPLDCLPEDVGYLWQIERNFLREAIKELSARRRYWQRLETWLLNLRGLLTNRAYWAWKDQMLDRNHRRTGMLMRSPYEDNGLRWSRKARTLAKKRVLVSSEHADPEDWLLSRERRE
jgi:hypothetical protein